MNLKPVDFKAVAAKGCFVYCYLRADGSPYYVGLATRHDRPFAKHVASVPCDHPERVRVLRSGLTWQEACKWEVFYIAHYGRKDLGTGILRNLTDGGEGNCNPSPKTRFKLSVAAQQHTLRLVALNLERKGKPLTPEHRAKVGRPGVPKSPEHKAKLAAHLRSIPNDGSRQPKDPAQKSRKLSEKLKGRTKTPEWKGRLSVSQKKHQARLAALTAHSFGLPYRVWADLTIGRKRTVKRRFARGLRGVAQLVSQEAL